MSLLRLQSLIGRHGALRVRVRLALFAILATSTIAGAGRAASAQETGGRPGQASLEAVLDGDLPPTTWEERSQLLAKVMFRILAFDRQLASRCEFGAVRVVIVRGEDPHSRQEAVALARALEEARGTTIAGLPYEYQVSDAAPRSESYEIVFLPSGLDPDVVRKTLDHTRRHGILCVTTDLSYIRNGAAVAIVATSHRPEIVIQKSRAQEQGAEFDPRLYAYSTVICD